MCRIDERFWSKVDATGICETVVREYDRWDHTAGVWVVHT